MPTAEHKATHYWLVALKILVLVLAFTYLFTKLQADFLVVGPKVRYLFTAPMLLSFAGFLLVALLNWVLEIWKWKQTVGIHFPTTFGEATRQSLGAFTAAIVTPNRIGEYGAKALYFKKGARKRVVFLNFLHNSSQMGATLLFGIPALWWVVFQYPINFHAKMLYLSLFLLVAFAVVAYIFRKKKLLYKGVTLLNLWHQMRRIPVRRLIQIVLLSIARYLLFSSLFYAILCFFEQPLPYLDVAPLIFSMYLLASVAPSFFGLDVVIRGSVGIWMFSFMEVSEMAILATVFVMWLLNVVLPALAGSYYVLTYKPKGI